MVAPLGDAGRDDVVRPIPHHRLERRTRAVAVLDRAHPQLERHHRAAQRRELLLVGVRLLHLFVGAALACGGEVEGIRLLSEEGVNTILEEQIRGIDLVFGVPMVFGMGFGLNDASFPISPNPRSFFWGGWGGSLAIIDLDARVSIAYVMNRMEANLMGDPRGASIAQAVYESLA